jgi:hypothetical protein
MSRWTELQATVRHRFGLDDVEGGRVGNHGERGGQTFDEAPFEAQDRGPSSTPCSWPDCELPAEGIVCRTHRVDAAVLLLEDDLLRLGTDWIFWIQEMRPL